MVWVAGWQSWRRFSSSSARLVRRSCSGVVISMHCCARLVGVPRDSKKHRQCSGVSTARRTRPVGGVAAKTTPTAIGRFTSFLTFAARTKGCGATAGPRVSTQRGPAFVTASIDVVKCPLYPQSGHWNSAMRCPLCAKSGHWRGVWNGSLSPSANPGVPSSRPEPRDRQPQASARRPA